MPTKLDMEEKALALAEKLGVSVSLKGSDGELLNFRRLSEVVRELEAKLAAKEKTSAGAVRKEDEAPPAPDEQVSPAVLALRKQAKEAADKAPKRQVPIAVPVVKRPIDRRAAYKVCEHFTLYGARGCLRAGDGVRKTDFTPAELAKKLEDGAIEKL